MWRYPGHGQDIDVTLCIERVRGRGLSVCMMSTVLYTWRRAAATAAARATDAALAAVVALALAGAT